MAEHDNVDQMLPKESPVSVQKSGVRRVNNLPLIIAMTALVLFTALIAMVAVKRSNNETAVEQTSKKNIDTSAMAKDVIGSYSAGLIPHEELANKTTEVIEPMSSLDTPPMLSHQMVDNNAPIPIDPDEQQIRMSKMQQFQDVVKAKTAIPIPSQLGTTNIVSSDAVPEYKPQTREEMLTRIADVQRQIKQQIISDPNDVYQAQLAKLQSSPGDNADASLQRTSTSNIQQFNDTDHTGQGDRWKLNQEMQPPRSRFEICAGNVIPGIMISGVNSDLPGQITGQVSQDVYDTATGVYLLIPQGTRLIGTYSSDVAYGQSAMMIVWQRLIFPDGKALDITSMPGADSAGYTGFRDQVNNHYFRIFASALLLSGVTAGISYSQDQNNNNGQNNSQQPTASSTLSKALGQQLGQVTAQMIAKNMNIAPTLEIRPGYRFNIIVVKDLDFIKPYTSFDYEN